MPAKTAAERKRNQRSREGSEASRVIREMGDAALHDALSASIEMLRRSGLPAPSPAELAEEPAADRALGIGRIIGAASKAVELARKRGELITATEHNLRLMEMAGAVKHAIGQFSAYLPGDLSPQDRERCSAAMKKASESAMANIERKVQ